MPPFDRKLWKNAVRIAAALHDEEPIVLWPAFPRTGLTTVSRLFRQLGSARDQGWAAAERKVHQALSTQTEWLLGDLRRWVTDLPRPRHEPAADPSSVYRDLIALKTEFEAVEVDRVRTTVTVTTGRIVLQEIDLGRFDLVWNWSQLGDDDELQVVPREPHSAASDSSVCHPHVRDNTLCVGGMGETLARAFRSGRLFDAFVIVRQILQTYNARSPYVALSDWEGTTCDDCAASISAGESWCCRRCEGTICEDCEATCVVCHSTVCSGCRKRCPRCEEFVCLGCRPLIDGRSQPLCETCFNEETDDDDETVDDSPSEGSTPPPGASTVSAAGASVRSDGVGEAPVSAGCGRDGDRRLRDQPPG